jgi:hypothetical protein
MSGHHAWYVLADVPTLEDGEEETDAMSFQIGKKDGKLDLYCSWDYDIFN